MHSTTCSTALGVAACKGRARARLSALRPSPCWADVVTTGTGGAVLYPVTAGTMLLEQLWGYLL